MAWTDIFFFFFNNTLPTNANGLVLPYRVSSSASETGKSIMQASMRSQPARFGLIFGMIAWASCRQFLKSKTYRKKPQTAYFLMLFPSLPSLSVAPLAVGIPVPLKTPTYCSGWYLRCGLALSLRSLPSPFRFHLNLHHLGCKSRHQVPRWLTGVFSIIGTSVPAIK